MGESKVISLRLPVEELEALKEAKWDLRKAVNQIVREAVNEYLAKNWKPMRRMGRRKKSTK